MFKITRIHVKNFRSIRECTFELKDLQLLIGPNNSGKSNLLRVFEFLRTISTTHGVREIDIDRVRFQHKEYHSKRTSISQLPDPIEVAVEFYNEDFKQWYYYKIELFRLTGNQSNRDSVHNSFVALGKERKDDEIFKNINLLDTVSLKKNFMISFLERNNTLNLQNDPLYSEFESPFGNNGAYSYELLIESKIKVVTTGNQLLGGFLYGYPGQHELISLKNEFRTIFGQLIIYKIDTRYVKLPISSFSIPQYIDGDCGNIVDYLESLLSSNIELSAKLNDELHRCIPDFISYNFFTNNAEQPMRYLRLKDRFDVSHLSEDVSEGTLYFLNFLSIIMQENIPPVLMIEEPEIGIHPRRIVEIIDYVFRLRDQRPGVSIILTSHHPYVVDQFSDLKDRVWVFDTENGETQIRNLERDVIEPSNERLKEGGGEPIDYSSSLSEHWAMGFLGGVPKPIAY